MLLKEENRLTERARAYASSADSRNGRSGKIDEMGEVSELNGKNL